MSSLVTKYNTLPDVIKIYIKSYVIFTPKTNIELQDAVNKWCNNKKVAYKLCGHISLWNTKYITNMKKLFCDKKYFSSVISSWDISNVIDTSYMFAGAKCFIMQSHLITQ